MLSRALSLTYAPSPTHSFAPHPAHPVKSLILVEPMIMPPAFALRGAAWFIKGAEKRQDTWASPAAAREAVGRSLGRQGWEGRCVKLYVVSVIIACGVSLFYFIFLGGRLLTWRKLCL